MYYYIYKFCNYILDIFYSYKSKILFIQDIKTIQENKKKTLIKLYFYYYLNYILTKMPIRTKLYFQSLLYNLDNNQLIKVQFSNGKINRNIIYKNISSFSLSKKININYNDSNLFNENEIIMMKKKIILDIFYKDSSNNKVSIKSIIENYADKSKKYQDNKLNNILQLENLNINKIHATYLQGLRRQEKEFNLEERDLHVSEIYDF